MVGSGAAGMVAALTAAHQGLSTLVVEKAAHYGGSTARSGGGVWIPNNEILKRDGVTDTAEAARTYLHAHHRRRRRPPRRIDTYLERGPEMLSFVLKNTPLKMCWVPGYSDYYPETPGGRPAGRSIEPKPFNAKKLGADEAGLEPPYGKVPLNVVVMQQDYVRLNHAQASPARRAAQPQGRRAHDVGQGHRQEPRRHGPRADRAAAHRPAEGRRAGPAEHRADRPVRRGRRGPRYLRPRHATHPESR